MTWTAAAVNNAMLAMDHARNRLKMLKSTRADILFDFIFARAANNYQRSEGGTVKNLLSNCCTFLSTKDPATKGALRLPFTARHVGDKTQVHRSNSEVEMGTRELFAAFVSLAQRDLDSWSEAVVNYETGNAFSRARN